MAWFTAFNAPNKAHVRLSVFSSTSPDLQAPHLLVTIQAASIALYYIRFNAVDREVANFIALKTDLLSAREGIM